MLFDQLDLEFFERLVAPVEDNILLVVPPLLSKVEKRWDFCLLHSQERVTLVNRSPRVAEHDNALDLGP